MTGTDWTKVRKAQQKREIEKQRKVEEEKMAKKNKGKVQPKNAFNSMKESISGAIAKVDSVKAAPEAEKKIEELKKPVATAEEKPAEKTVAVTPAPKAAPAPAKEAPKTEEKKPEVETAETKAEVKTEAKAEAKPVETKAPAKMAEKPAAKKAPTKKTAAKKPAVKKAATKKPAAKKAAAPTFDTFLEYNGDQINVSLETIRARIEDAYKTEGHRAGNIKSLQVYLNLDERRAYYVINGKPEDKYVEI